MSRADKRYTTSRGNVLALSQAIQSYGVSPEPILRAGNVDLAQIDDNNRLSGEAMDALVCLAVEATGDKAFGLRFVDFVQPTSFHALGVALLYSATLRSFCQRLERYFTMITNMDEIRFVDAGEECFLAARFLFDYSAPARQVNADAWVSYILKLLRQICSPDFSPQRVALIWTPPEALQPKYEAVFQCPLEFSATESKVYLDPATLDQPLPIANTELARQNDHAVAEYLARLDKPDFPALVQMKLIEFLPSGQCDRERVARALHMTVRTMHNKLEREGTSYRALLEETRRELAQEYIEKNHHAISEIAYLLGYADVGNFSRAFKRWTGVSPNNYLGSR